MFVIYVKINIIQNLINAYLTKIYRDVMFILNPLKIVVLYVYNLVFYLNKEIHVLNKQKLIFVKSIKKIMVI